MVALYVSKVVNLHIHTKLHINSSIQVSLTQYSNLFYPPLFKVPVSFRSIAALVKDLFQDSISIIALKRATSLSTVVAWETQTTSEQKRSVSRHAHVSYM